MRVWLRDPTDDEIAAVPPVQVLIGDTADLQEAWKMYTWMAAFDFHFLPGAGGLEDQDEVLMTNIMLIKASVARLRGA